MIIWSSWKIFVVCVRFFIVFSVCDIIRWDIVWFDILIGFLKFFFMDVFLRVDFVLDFKFVVYLIVFYKNLFF